MKKFSVLLLIVFIASCKSGKETGEENRREEAGKRAKGSGMSAW